MAGRLLLTEILDREVRAPVRDDFTRLTAAHMREQARLIFTGFILSLPMVVYGASPGAGPLIAWGLPLGVLVASLMGLAILRTPIDWHAPVVEAQSLIRRTWGMCVVISAIGSLWCIGSWATAPAEVRIYYPAIMSLGALTLGYCLSAVRAVGVSALAITLLPAALALTTTGQGMDLVLAIGMLIAAGFQVVMMGRHRQLLLRLVEERHRSSELAHTDSLTGLANRRALLERFTAWARGDTLVRLMVIDIDRFKTINDEFGHDMGDDVLRAFAEILRLHARGSICAARLGGEEFALLAPASALDPALALQLLAEIRGAYMPHGERLTASIGVAEARVADPSHWTALYRKADRALYAAKEDGRNRVITVDADAPEANATSAPRDARTA